MPNLSLLVILSSPRGSKYVVSVFEPSLATNQTYASPVSLLFRRFTDQTYRVLMGWEVERSRGLIRSFGEPDPIRSATVAFDN